MMLELVLNEVFFYYRFYYVELFVEGMLSLRIIFDKY